MITTENLLFLEKETITSGFGEFSKSWCTQLAIHGSTTCRGKNKTVRNRKRERESNEGKEIKRGRYGRVREEDKEERERRRR